MKIFILLLALGLCLANAVPGGYQQIDITEAQADPTIQSYIQTGLDAIVKNAINKGFFSNSNFTLVTLNSVAEQVVNGTNYKFDCNFTDSAGVVIEANFVLHQNATTNATTVTSYAYQVYYPATTTTTTTTTTPSGAPNTTADNTTTTTTVTGQANSNSTTQTATTTTTDAATNSTETSTEASVNSTAPVTNETAVVSHDGFVHISADELSQSDDLRKIFLFGFENVVQNGINFGKIPNITFAAAKILGASHKTLKNGELYKFTAEASNGDNVDLELGFEVSVRVPAYTYRVKVTTNNTSGDNSTTGAGSGSGSDNNTTAPVDTGAGAGSGSDNNTTTPVDTGAGSGSDNNTTVPVDNGSGSDNNTTTPVDTGAGSGSDNNTTTPVDNGSGSNTSTTTPVDTGAGSGSDNNTTTPVDTGAGSSSDNNTTTPVDNGSGSNTNTTTPVDTNTTTPVDTNTTTPVDTNTTTNTTSPSADEWVAINPAQVQQSAELQSNLAQGFDQVIQAVAQKKLLAADNYTITQVTAISYHNLTKGVNYKFNVKANNDAQTLFLDMNFTTYYRYSNKSVKAVSYHYNYHTKAAPVQNNTGNNTAPAQNTTIPAQNNTTPAQNSTAPAQNTTTPAQNNTAAAQNNTNTAPAQNTTTPAQNNTAPAQNNTVPAQNNTAPAQNNTTPAQNATAPAQNNTIPAQNTTAPAQNTTNSTNGYVALSADEIQAQDVQNAINYGSTQVVQLGIQKNKIPSDTYNITNVASVLKKIQASGVYYNAIVTLQSAANVTVNANFNVYYDSTSNAMTLKAYSYGVTGIKKNNGNNNNQK